MEYDTLLEIVAAAHLSQYVSSMHYSRGGLMLVAPPGALKTTVNDVMNQFPRTFVLSDINMQQIAKMRQYFLSGEIRTLGFSDYSKLYKRNPSVAQNLEGVILALTDEGFRRAAFQTQVPSTILARCTIIGGMTMDFHERMTEQWSANGFTRRFVWARYVLANPELLEEAALDGRIAQLTQAFIPKIPVASIPETIDHDEKELIRRITLHVHYKANTIGMLRKMLAVLKWKFGKRKARGILEDFAPCLSKDGGVLVLREVR